MNERKKEGRKKASKKRKNKRMKTKTKMNERIKERKKKKEQAERKKKKNKQIRKGCKMKATKSKKDLLKRLLNLFPVYFVCTRSAYGKDDDYKMLFIPYCSVIFITADFVSLY